MNILSIPMMAVSSKAGWTDLERIHPSLAMLFGRIIVPLSLLPPFMLYFAGTHYGDAFAEGFGSKPWGDIAVAFFLVEMLTVLAMGWLVRQVASAHGASFSVHDAYLVAGIAPVPLWLSSLGLLVPSFSFNAALMLLALGASCSLVYHGIYAFCHMHEGVSAVAITQTVMGAGLIAWALLLLTIVAV